MVSLTSEYLKKDDIKKLLNEVTSRFKVFDSMMYSDHDVWWTAIWLHDNFNQNIWIKFTNDNFTLKITWTNYQIKRWIDWLVNLSSWS